MQKGKAEVGRGTSQRSHGLKIGSWLKKQESGNCKRPGWLRCAARRGMVILVTHTLTLLPKTPSVRTSLKGYMLSSVSEIALWVHLKGGGGGMCEQKPVEPPQK